MFYKRSLLAVLAVCLLAVPAVVTAASDNSMSVVGGVVQISSTGSPAVWFAVVETSKGPIRVQCSGSTQSDCSAFTGSTPTLLNTGGCYPVEEVVSGSTHVWTCTGSGTGSCRIFSGFIQGSTFSSITTPTATDYDTCF